MKPAMTKVVPLEWNEAKNLEQLLNNAANERQALVVDPKQGVTGAVPAGLISPNDSINGSVRFTTHYSC